MSNYNFLYEKKQKFASNFDMVLDSFIIRFQYMRIRSVVDPICFLVSFSQNSCKTIQNTPSQQHRIIVGWNLVLLCIWFFLERYAPYKSLCMSGQSFYPVYLLRSYHGYSINNRWQTSNSFYCAVNTDIEQQTICFKKFYYLL